MLNRTAQTENKPTEAKQTPDWRQLINYACAHKPQHTITVVLGVGGGCGWGGYQACSCAGSTHISFQSDMRRGWHVQSCFTLFPFYTQTTSHCHHSILQIPKGPLKSTVSALASSQAPRFLLESTSPRRELLLNASFRVFFSLGFFYKQNNKNIPKHTLLMLLPARQKLLLHWKVSSTSTMPAPPHPPSCLVTLGLHYTPAWHRNTPWLYFTTGSQSLTL